MRADRLLAIMLLLQARGKMTAARLAETLEVSRRTVLRDLDALSAAGVPVHAEGGHGGGVWLDERYRTTLTGLGEREAPTLFLGDSAQLLGDLGLGEAARQTLRKLSAALPAASRPSVEHMRQRILIDPAGWWRDALPPEAWEQLQRAVYESVRVRAVYERPGGEVLERVLEPYSLVAKSGSWYLVASHAEGMRTYRVARLRGIELLAERFERRGDFDLPAYWQEQLRQVGELTSDYACALRVHPDGMALVRRVVPGGQQEAGPPGEDGWATVRLRLDSADLARMLALGLGAHAAVLEPPELAESVRRTAADVLRAAGRGADGPHGV